MTLNTKESSDELNPSVVTTGVDIARPGTKRSFVDYIALAIATCGVGYLPLAPGTWGSLVGVGAYIAWQSLRWDVFSALKGQGMDLALFALTSAVALIAVLVVTMTGIWAATRVERFYGQKDPGIIVIDEVAGQMITFLFIPIMRLKVEWPLIIAGFLLFRLFDIWKPYPIRRLEALESGLGIMADDVLAGIYAATVLSALTVFYFLI